MKQQSSMSTETVRAGGPRAGSAYDDFASWAKEADEEELLLLREEAESTPLKTWMVPDVCDMDHCIRDWYMHKIRQELDVRLARGDLSMLLSVPVVSERIMESAMHPRSIAYWRLNRADFLADVDLDVDLTVARDGLDVPATFSLVVTLWFSTDEGLQFEVQEVCLAEDRPERSFWKLDRHLVPILRSDEVETGADHLWETWLPGKKDPKERTAQMLAEAMGLTVRELRLHGQNRTRAILFFREGTVQVQEEMRRDEELPPPPVPVLVEANTIIVNTAFPRNQKSDLDILHECVHFDWHLLFYRLQKAVSSSPLSFRMKAYQSSVGRRPADPLRWIENQADHAAIALLLPREAMRSLSWRLYQQASVCRTRDGYFNHPGFRWETVMKNIAGKYSVPFSQVRRRMVMLGHPEARGSLNYMDGHYITPFAFADMRTEDRDHTLVISRKEMAAVYHRSKDFRSLLETGSFLWVDGHVCLNDPQYLLQTKKGLSLTPWANAHADVCCLSFRKIRLRDREAVLVFGTLNSSEEYNRRYNEFLDSRMALTSAQLAEKRNRLMKALPNDYPDALRYLMENADGGRVTSEALAERSLVSVSTVKKYRTRLLPAYQPDIAVALCLGLHLPPWLSRVLLNKAGILVQNYGPRGHFGEILDCCFMDSLPEIQAYLKNAGYPALKLLDD